MFGKRVISVRVLEIGEFGLIRRLRAIVESSVQATSDVLVGIGDDAAVVSCGGKMVLTADALVEGVHFRRDWISMEAVGYRAMAASLSDVAAMGGRPLFALVTLALPYDEEVEPIEKLYRGMVELCDASGVRIVGGDVVATPGPLMLTVSLTGELLGEQPLTRSGAQAGDWIFVTGDIGGAAAFVHRMQGKGATGILAADDEWSLRLRHERPQPQLAAARMLVACDCCTSLNDISDGLASELHELAQASGVQMRVWPGRIPTLPAVRHYARMADVTALDLAFFGGEDFQLVGTVKEAAAGALLARMEAVGVRLSYIGRVHEGDASVLLETEQGRVALGQGGYDHFAVGDAQ